MSTVRASTAIVEAEPSQSHFITVDGTRLRYLDRGSGAPVLLLHGNGSMIEDFVASGIMDDAPHHRFIAFDRPGFGHSERPAGRAWGPFEQASLLLNALARLEIERPIIVGHSWGTLVALAMALQSAEPVAGLVLLAGYYYPTPRADAIRVPAAAFPFVRRLMASDTMRRVFAPCTVPERFKRTYPMPLAMRLSQMRTVDEEAAMLLGAAKTLCQFYGELNVPVRLIAGSHDRIVDTDQHSLRLHLDLASSAFTRLPGVGHMVHHAAPDEVLQAIAAVGAHHGGKDRQPSSDAEDQRPTRQWLHIGGDLVAA